MTFCSTPGSVSSSTASPPAGTFIVFMGHGSVRQCDHSTLPAHLRGYYRLEGVLNAMRAMGYRVVFLSSFYRIVVRSLGDHASPSPINIAHCPSSLPLRRMFAPPHETVCLTAITAPTSMLLESYQIEDTTRGRIAASCCSRASGRLASCAVTYSVSPFIGDIMVE